MSITTPARTDKRAGMSGDYEPSRPADRAADRVTSEGVAQKAQIQPGNRVVKALLKAPVLLWRLGLGRFTGHSLMIMTTTGRKSGLPRRTPIQFHAQGGRKYIVTLRGPNTDWYRNMMADPRITIQTAAGSEHVRAHRVSDDREIGDLYSSLSKLPVMRRWANALGVPLSREAVIAHKDSFILMSLDPTDEHGPSALQPDLWWAWPVAEAFALVVWLLVRTLRRRRVYER